MSARNLVSLGPERGDQPRLCNIEVGLKCLPSSLAIWLEIHYRYLLSLESVRGPVSASLSSGFRARRPFL